MSCDRTTKVREFAQRKGALFLFLKLGICGASRICRNRLLDGNRLGRPGGVSHREHDIQVRIQRAVRAEREWNTRLDEGAHGYVIDSFSVARDEDTVSSARRHATW
jgi:hypothetical protein